MGGTSAQAGAEKSIGVDYRSIFNGALDFVAKAGVNDKVYLMTDPLQNLGEGGIDVIASQNAFEYFKDPAVTLADAKYVLKQAHLDFLNVSHKAAWATRAH